MTWLIEQVQFVEVQFFSPKIKKKVWFSLEREGSIFEVTLVLSY